MLPAALTLAACALGPRALLAQRSGADTTHAGHDMAMHQAPAPQARLLDLGMARMGSGTTWVPEGAALPSRHFSAGAWSVMAHGFAFAQYDYQDGPRGDSQFGSLNWGMLMASRPLAGGRFEARTMVSLDALTVGGRGYPLLLQSGESYGGSAIHDRQHPHDAWMELGVLYERPLTSRLGISMYAAPSGEPALGPVAFMHRPSAMDNPIAPIGHHGQDATHVAFGVFTGGLFTERWKFEGSAFNGREPDEHRWNVDLDRMDSYAGRVTFNPTARWSMTAGYGVLESPERSHPGEQTRRVVGSLLYGAPLPSGGQWATSAVFGTNGAHGHWTNSALFEAEAVLDARNTVFGRAERVEKSAEDLVLDIPGADPELALGVSSLSVGYVRETWQSATSTFGIGAMATLSLVPTSAAAAYGSRTPVGLMVFGRIRLRAAAAGAMHRMEMAATP